jgi:hypothetical protein
MRRLAMPAGAVSGPRTRHSRLTMPAWVVVCFMAGRAMRMGLSLLAAACAGEDSSTTTVPCKQLGQPGYFWLPLPPCLVIFGRWRAIRQVATWQASREQDLCCLPASNSWPATLQEVIAGRRVAHSHISAALLGKCRPLWKMPSLSKNATLFFKRSKQIGPRILQVRACCAARRPPAASRAETGS